MWDCLENNITTVLNNICPIREVIVPESKPNWLTNDIVQLMRRKDKVIKRLEERRIPYCGVKQLF